MSFPAAIGGWVVWLRGRSERIVAKYCAAFSSGAAQHKFCGVFPVCSVTPIAVQRGFHHLQTWE